MKKFMIVFMVMCFLIVGCAFKYENVIEENVMGVVQIIKTEFKDGKTKAVLSCNSFHIGDGYFVTCTHGVKLTSRKVITPFGHIEVAVNGTDYKYFIGEDELEFVGEIGDISLFYNPFLKYPQSVRFGDSDLLKVGDKLLSIGNTNMAGHNIKTGIISKIGLDHPLLDNDDARSENSFIMTAPTNRGDSGGPVFSIYKGRYYLVGMIYATLDGADGYGFTINSNYIKKIVEEIKNDKF